MVLEVVMFGFLTDSAKFIAASSLTYRLLNWDQQNYSWADAFRNVAASMLNYSFFYYSGTIGRLTAQAFFPVFNGPAPSIFWLPAYMDYHYEQTLMIDYAIDYAPYVILPLGVKISQEVVRLLEKAGTHIIQKGMDAYYGESNNTLRFATTPAASQPSQITTTASSSKRRSRKKI